MFISDAFAAAPAATTASTTAPASAAPAVTTGADISPLMSMAQLFLPLIVVGYFFIIRPQQKRIKDQEAMLKGLRRGDKVVTGGGIIGVIHKVEGEDVFVVEIAPDVRVRVMRDTVSHVVTKTVANDNKPDDKNAAAKD